MGFLGLHEVFFLLLEAPQLAPLVSSSGSSFRGPHRKSHHQGHPEQRAEKNSQKNRVRKENMSTPSAAKHTGSPRTPMPRKKSGQNAAFFPPLAGDGWFYPLRAWLDGEAADLGPAERVRRLVGAGSGELWARGEVPVGFPDKTKRTRSRRWVVDGQPGWTLLG